MGDLVLSTAVGFTNGTAHGVGHLVSIQYGPALQVSSCPADGLNQRALRAQEAFLITIQNRYQ